MTSIDSGRSTPARPVSELFSDPRLREKLGVEEIELSSTPPEVPRRRTRGRDPATRLEDGMQALVFADSADSGLVRALGVAGACDAIWPLGLADR